MVERGPEDNLNDPPPRELAHRRSSVGYARACPYAPPVVVAVMDLLRPGRPITPAPRTSNAQSTNIWLSFLCAARIVRWVGYAVRQVRVAHRAVSNSGISVK